MLRPGRNCLLVSRAESGVIVDACDYFRAVADAIESARTMVLITGWQLDTRVVLRRDAGEDPNEHTLAAVLKRACARSPELEVRVLPWDWSPVYTIDREWATAARLEEIADGRVHCVWDAAHPAGASQHEKMVLIDGHTAFVGGIDLCDSRWDDRHHLPADPRRVDLDGEPYGPYHDVQAVVRGEVVHELVKVFVDRWARAGGAPFSPRIAPTPREPPWCHHPIAPAEVAIVRTRPADPRDGRPEIRELEQLMTDAIAAAESHVYIETQYLTSHAMGQALVQRLRDTSRPRLEIVVLLPRRTEGRLERAAVANPQRVMLHALRRTADANGHRFGVYCPAMEPSAEHAESEKAPPITYVHSKLCVVDDRILVIGSANLTNRSMGFDSELCLAWCTERPDASLRAIRLALLSEHIAISPDDAEEVIGEVRGLVAKLDALTCIDAAQLVAHSFVDQPDDPSVLDDVFAEIGDPARADDLGERAAHVMERLGDAVLR
ncbi:MAG: phospholipase [Deltaproteobacteria bacterium]|nr:phospholipase [Deltaproteobacteria bacterium]